MSDTKKTNTALIVTVVVLGVVAIGAAIQYAIKRGRDSVIGLDLYSQPGGLGSYFKFVDGLPHPGLTPQIVYNNLRNFLINPGNYFNEFVQDIRFKGQQGTRDYIWQFSQMHIVGLPQTNITASDVKTELDTLMNRLVDAEKRLPKGSGGNTVFEDIVENVIPIAVGIL